MNYYQRDRLTLDNKHSNIYLALSEKNCHGQELCKWPRPLDIRWLFRTWESVEEQFVLVDVMKAQQILSEISKMKLSVFLICLIKQEMVT